MTRKRPLPPDFFRRNNAELPQAQPGVAARRSRSVDAHRSGPPIEEIAEKKRKPRKRTSRMPRLRMRKRVPWGADWGQVDGKIEQLWCDTPIMRGGCVGKIECGCDLGGDGGGGGEGGGEGGGGCGGEGGCGGCGGEGGCGGCDGCDGCGAGAGCDGCGGCGGGCGGCGCGCDAGGGCEGACGGCGTGGCSTGTGGACASADAGGCSPGGGFGAGDPGAGDPGGGFSGQGVEGDPGASAFGGPESGAFAAADPGSPGSLAGPESGAFAGPESGAFAGPESGFAGLAGAFAGPESGFTGSFTGPESAFAGPDLGTAFSSPEQDMGMPGLQGPPQETGPSQTGMQGMSIAASTSQATPGTTSSLGFGVGSTSATASQSEFGSAMANAAAIGAAMGVEGTTAQTEAGMAAVGATVGMDPGATASALGISAGSISAAGLGLTGSPDSPDPAEQIDIGGPIGVTWDTFDGGGNFEAAPDVASTSEDAPTAEFAVSDNPPSSQEGVMPNSGGMGQFASSDFNLPPSTGFDPSQGVAPEAPTASEQGTQAFASGGQEEAGPSGFGGFSGFGSQPSSQDTGMTLAGLFGDLGGGRTGGGDFNLPSTIYTGGQEQSLSPFEGIHDYDPSPTVPGGVGGTQFAALDTGTRTDTGGGGKSQLEMQGENIYASGPGSPAYEGAKDFGDQGARTTEVSAVTAPPGEEKTAGEVVELPEVTVTPDKAETDVAGESAAGDLKGSGGRDEGARDQGSPKGDEKSDGNRGDGENVTLSDKEGGSSRSTSGEGRGVLPENTTEDSPKAEFQTAQNEGDIDQPRGNLEPIPPDREPPPFPPSPPPFPPSEDYAQNETRDPLTGAELPGPGAMPETNPVENIASNIFGALIPSAEAGRASDVRLAEGLARQATADNPYVTVFQPGHGGQEGSRLAFGTDQDMRGFSLDKAISGKVDYIQIAGSLEELGRTGTLTLADGRVIPFIQTDKGAANLFGADQRFHLDIPAFSKEAKDALRTATIQFDPTPNRDLLDRQNDRMKGWAEANFPTDRDKPAGATMLADNSRTTMNPSEGVPRTPGPGDQDRARISADTAGIGLEFPTKNERDAANSGKLDAELVSRLNEMYQAMPQSVKDAVEIRSAFRTEQEQRQMRAAGQAEHFAAAKPGGSQHEFGLAVDIDKNTREARDWVNANMANFGLQAGIKNDEDHTRLAPGFGSQLARNQERDQTAVTREPREPPPMDVIPPAPPQDVDMQHHDVGGPFIPGAGPSQDMVEPPSGPSQDMSLPDAGPPLLGGPDLMQQLINAGGPITSLEQALGPYSSPPSLGPGGDILQPGQEAPGERSFDPFGPGSAPGLTEPQGPAFESQGGHQFPGGGNDQVYDSLAAGLPLFGAGGDTLQPGQEAPGVMAPEGPEPAQPPALDLSSFMTQTQPGPEGDLGHDQFPDQEWPLLPDANAGWLAAQQQQGTPGPGNELFPPSGLGGFDPREQTAGVASGEFGNEFRPELFTPEDTERATGEAPGFTPEEMRQQKENEEFLAAHPLGSAAPQSPGERPSTKTEADRAVDLFDKADRAIRDGLRGADRVQADKYAAYVTRQDKIDLVTGKISPAEFMARVANREPNIMVTRTPEMIQQYAAERVASLERTVAGVRSEAARGAAEQRAAQQEFESKTRDYAANMTGYEARLSQAAEGFRPMERPQPPEDTRPPPEPPDTGLPPMTETGPRPDSGALPYPPGIHEVAPPDLLMGAPRGGQPPTAPPAAPGPEVNRQFGGPVTDMPMTGPPSAPNQQGQMAAPSAPPNVPTASGLGSIPQNLISEGPPSFSGEGPSPTYSGGPPDPATRIAAHQLMQQQPGLVQQVAQMRGISLAAAALLLAQSMPHMAGGGHAQAEQPIVVGERGPEVFTPGVPGVISPTPWGVTAPAPAGGTYQGARPPTRSYIPTREAQPPMSMAADLGLASVPAAIGSGKAGWPGSGPSGGWPAPPGEPQGPWLDENPNYTAPPMRPLTAEDRARDKRLAENAQLGGYPDYHPNPAAWDAWFANLVASENVDDRRNEEYPPKRNEKFPHDRDKLKNKGRPN